MLVDVYFNLHKHVWSIRAAEGPQKGKVVAHAETVTLRDATFKVSEAGRQRVLHEQRKNVHAVVRGALLWHGTTAECDALGRQTFWADVYGVDMMDCDPITYNPYKYKTFVAKSDESPVEQARFVHMSDRRVYGYDAFTPCQ
jgi:hypothetical protein